MKKNNPGSRSNDRRKTTRDERSPKRDEQDNLCWDDLTKLNHRARAMFSTVDPAIVIIRAPNIKEVMGDQYSRLYKMAEALLRDVELYKSGINQIESQHAGKKGGEDNPTLVLESLNIGNQYIQWCENFETVVCGNVKDILFLYENALSRYVPAPPVSAIPVSMPAGATP